MIIFDGVPTEPTAADLERQAARLPSPTTLLAEAKEVQRQVIRDALAVNQRLPVYDSGRGAWWNGGIESALQLDGARRLAQELGQPTVDFYDVVSNSPHTLDIAQASIVVYLVAGRYQIDYARKQAQLNEIDTATTVEAVVAVVW